MNCSRNDVVLLPVPFTDLTSHKVRPAIGSGAIEANCRQTQCRFKRPGQFWSRAGDEALLGLETFWRNGRWQLLFPNTAYTPATN